MAFPDIFGQKKKDSPEPTPAPKRETPSWLGESEDAPASSAAPREPMAVRAVAEDSGESLSELTDRLERLDKVMNQTKEQVLAYLLHRDAKPAGGDQGKSADEKFDGMLDKMVSYGLVLDAIHRKVDQLASAGPRAAAAGAASAGDGGGSGISESALKSAVRPVGEKLEQFEAKLKSIDALKDGLVAAITKLRDSHAEQHNSQSAGIQQIAGIVQTMPQSFNTVQQSFTGLWNGIHQLLQQNNANLLQGIHDIIHPPQPEPAAAEPAVGGDWQEALLGGELAHNPALNHEKSQLLNGVLRGDPGACGVVGNLLLFRAAAADKMPPLLKDVGEAFYRWQPKTSNRPSEFEKALVEWLMRACDQAGMANTIELVNPGERFDSLRHNASRPGVEITQVLGWIVLRDNGKVYTKASVAVK